MGSKSSKAPKPPDPKVAADAQAKMNIDTALAQNAINRTNQITDDGSIIYTETGKQTVGGREIPIYTATTTLSDAQKRIKNEADAAKYNLANAANYLSGRINKEPFKVDEEVEARLFDLGSKRLAPRLEEARRQAETDAANRGLRLGSDAYDRLMRQVGENENDAYNQLAVTGRAEAYAEADRNHTRDLNYLTALLSGSQVSQPNFVSNTPQAGVANTPYAQIIDGAYQNQLAAYQQEQAEKNAMLGGLFGLAGTAIAYSDRRLKEDIHKVGETPDDLGIYSYRYKGGGPLRLGLIAQEVEKEKPEAVVKSPDGFKMVDYRKALRLGERAGQTSGLVPTPRPHPFRDPDRFSYSLELADMAKVKGIPAYDQLAERVAPGTLSRLANLQTMFGKPFDVYGAYSPGHTTDSQHKLGKAFDINLSTSIPERARLIEAATQMGFAGTGTYDKNIPGVPNPGVHIDVGRRRSWGGHTKKTGSLPAPDWHKAAIRRGLAAGEPDMEAIAAKVAAGYPIYDRSGRRR